MNISELFSNPLFLNFLAAAGKDMSAGKPFGENLGTAVMQNIGAQSQFGLEQSQGQNPMLQMLTQMMSGQLVPGSSMKMSDDGKLNLSLPPQAAPQAQQATQSGTTNINQALAQQGSGLPGGSGINWADPRQLGKLSSVLNPFQWAR